jgi:hypothetical protein
MPDLAGMLDEAATENGWHLVATSAARALTRVYEPYQNSPEKRSVTMTFTRAGGKLISAVIITRAAQGPFTVTGQGAAGVVAAVLTGRWD